MRTLERYFLQQVQKPVLGAVAALTAIALLSQSLSQFDLVVERGQSALTFLKVTFLSIPQLAGILFPLSIFVGSLVAINRLHGDHETIASYTSGLSLSQLSSAVLRVSVYLALIGLIINLFIQPLTMREMRRTLFKIENDLISTMVHEGEFSTSSSGLTVYVQRVDQNNHLRQIFVRAIDDDGRDRTYSAREGRIINKDGSTVMIMRDGSTQKLNDKGILEHLSFEEYSFDMTNYFNNDKFLIYKSEDRYLHELLAPADLIAPNKKKRDEFLAEAHSRLSVPLYTISFAALALIAILAGKFNRNGYGLRITVAAIIALFVRILGVVMTSVCANAPELNFMQYVLPLIPIIICWRLIRRNDRSNLSFREVVAMRRAKSKMAEA